MKPSGSKHASLGAGCLTLFGLPFAGIGVWMTWRLVSMLATAWAAAGWVERPATLTKVELETHRGESTTYKVIAEYGYEFDGRPYQSDRVAVSSTADSMGRYHKRLHRRLEEAMAAGQTVPCYVDPSQPEVALLDRELRWQVVVFHLPFVICFSLAGFGLIGGSWYGVSRLRHEEARRALHPNEPWRFRPDWEAGEIRSAEANALAWPGLFAVFWNSLCVPMFVLMLDQGDVEWWVILLVGLFPLVGAGLAATFFYRLARYVRHGRSVLRLAKTPGVVGGELVGVVLAPSSAPTDGPFRVRLACLQTTERRDSDGDTTRAQNAVWEDTRVVARTLHDPTGRRGVPVRFVIPSDARPTDTEANMPLGWRLSVTAETPGPDYQAEFDVPVFRTADSREGVTVETMPLTEFEVEETLTERLARERLRFTQDEARDELTLASPPGRLPLTGLIMLTVGVAFVGVAVGVTLLVDAWIKWLLLAGFGGLGAPVAYIGLDMLLRSVDLEISGDEWRVRSGWWGWRRETCFTAADVASITAKQAITSSTDGEETQRWNDLVARLRDKRKVKLATFVKDRAVERELLAELRRMAKRRSG